MTRAPTTRYPPKGPPVLITILVIVLVVLAILFIARRL